MNREAHIVGFQVGRETYGVPITSLHEIVRVPEITAVPDAPAYMEGVINLRGKIVPVLDLRKRFGLMGREFTGQARIIVVNIDTRVLGLMVDSVSEVLWIPSHTIEPPPPLVAGIDAAYIKGVGRFEGRLLILLDLGKVLSAPQTENLVVES